MSLRLFPGLFGRLATAARTQQQCALARGARNFTARSGPRLDGKQFFTPFKRPAAPGASAGAGAGAAGWRGAGVGGLLNRAFGTSKPADIIRTQWTKGQRGPRRPPRMSWWQKLRWRIDQVSGQNMTIALLGINVLVFLAWQYAMNAWQRFGDPSVYQAMVKNFILNWPNVQAGRLWVLITSCFSHEKPTHIFVNALCLWFFGPAVAGVLGTSGFLAFYLGAGVFSALTSLAWQKYSMRRTLGSEGASGAIYGCTALYAALFPRSTFLLFFVLPMPAWMLVGGGFAWDLINTIYNPSSRIDGAGHMGGVIFGVATALLLKRSYRRRW